MWVVRKHNADCRDCVEVSPKGDVHFRRETRVDEDSPFDCHRRRIQVGSVTRTRRIFHVEYVSADYRSAEEQPTCFLRGRFESLDRALAWLVAQIDVRKLPAGFDRAIELTKAA